MRPGPATQAASFVELSSCLRTARRPRDEGTGPTALARSATFTGTGCGTAIRRIAFPHPLRLPAAQPAQRAGCGGGRNAWATDTRLRAFSISPGNSPSRIAGCHRRHRNHRSASVEKSNVFAEPTLGHNVASRNRKTFGLCAETVEDETSLWKAEEKREGMCQALLREGTDSIA